MEPSPPNASLGRLVDVPVRDIWRHEAHDFTPWLLANADVLSSVLHMDLELHAAEHPVGDFSLDLVGVDAATGDLVIVENQLEGSDHRHLGQILTYAGGTDPVNIVWVAPDFRAEHRAAIDWLNARTDERTRFFAVVVSVVKIGDSAAAPLLRLVAEPNDWGKSVRQSTAASAASPKGQLYQQFWTTYLDTLRSRQLGWTNAQAGPAENWIYLKSGVAGVSYASSFAREGLRSELVFETSDADAWFAAAESRKHEIERAFGQPLEWEPIPGRRRCRIATYRDASIESTEQWPELVDWLIDTQRRLRAAIATVGGLASLRPSAGD